MRNSSDNRAVKTREAIYDSFLALLRRKKFEDISVKEICEGARCGRNTFYLHYPYKEALYDQVIDGCVAVIRHSFRATVENVWHTNEDTMRQGVEDIFSALCRISELLQILITSDSTNTFCARLTDKIYEAMVWGAAQIAPKPAREEAYRLLCRFCAGGIVTFFLEWQKSACLSESEAKGQLLSVLMPCYQVQIAYLKEHY